LKKLHKEVGSPAQSMFERHGAGKWRNWFGGEVFGEMEKGRWGNILTGRIWRSEKKRGVLLGTRRRHLGNL